jgi:hypothetical protein
MPGFPLPAFKDSRQALPYFLSYEHDREPRIYKKVWRWEIPGKGSSKVALLGMWWGDMLP